MKSLNVDLDLVRKYNVAGPRYTSYPPATRFTDQFRWPELAEEIIENNQTERDLSLYFHIPFCRSLCWYCGCTTVITQSHRKGAVYLKYLETELERMCTMLNPKRQVVQWHLGGGTPTLLLPKEIRALNEIVRAHFNVTADVEAGVEIDPRAVTREHLDALREAGFKRASVGIQDFDSRVQKAVHRLQPRELTEQVVDWILGSGFTSLNIDLIYGLPYQTEASFERTLDAVLTFQPDRLAVFSYAHVPWIKPAQKILEKQNALPSAETKLNLLKLVIEKLTGAGYVYIGMDHFARPDDELAIHQRNKTLQRNFQGYSTRGDTDMYSFGMSSISKTDDVYWQNEKDLGSYYAALDAATIPIAKAYFMIEDDKIRREVIMQLMCNLELDFESVSRKVRLDIADYFRVELDSLRDLEADGLIRRSEGALKVTELGRMFIRNIAMRFDAYLPNETERRFSRTI
jgi:oxygen-independent coproporphyrinogen-3 oxidase